MYIIVFNLQRSQGLPLTGVLCFPDLNLQVWLTCPAATGPVMVVAAADVSFTKVQINESNKPSSEDCRHQRLLRFVASAAN